MCLQGWGFSTLLSNLLGGGQQKHVTRRRVPGQQLHHKYLPLLLPNVRFCLIHSAYLSLCVFCQLSDVDATRIKFLSDQSRDYLFTRVQVARFTDSTFRCRQLAEARSRFFHLSTAPVDSRGLNPTAWVKDEVDDWIEAQLGGELGAEPPGGAK